jgi:hypothetical protein
MPSVIYGLQLMQKAPVTNDDSTGSAIGSKESSSPAEGAAPVRGNRRGRPRGRAGRQPGRQALGISQCPVIYGLQLMQKAPVTNDDSTGSAVTTDDSTGSALPPSALPPSGRRSARLVRVKRQYIVQDLFPMLSDVEDEDDGIAFCWRDED